MKMTAGQQNSNIYYVRRKLQHKSQRFMPLYGNINLLLHMLKPKESSIILMVFSVKCPQVE